MLNLGILISGRGSNMESILKSIKKKKIPINPAIVISNKADAKGLKIAEKLGVDIEVIESKGFKSRLEYDKKVISVLSKYGVTQKNGLVCLAGFMRIISPEFVKKYKNRIINIHPALLPKFGGKGMFGINIHKAGHDSTWVENWSEGCQVFKRVKDFDQFMKICKMAAQIHGNHFSYTLIESKDII